MLYYGGGDGVGAGVFLDLHQGRSYVYAKTHLRTHLEQTCGEILLQF